MPEDVFYRARLHMISNNIPFSAKEMLAPKKEISKSGRANPMGIPYLYLCDNMATTLYEIRATYFDEVTIGKFSLSENFKEDAFISDFTEKINLFSDSSSVNQRIKSTLLRKLISDDLSKPMRRYDSEVDYIPTQFICEFIMNYTNVKGIKFKSSLDSNGNNLVIFDPSIMKCIGTELRKVSSLRINSEKMG